MSKILLDSNIYVRFLRSGEFEQSIKALYTFRTRDIYFSSVVIEELFQGAADEEARKHVETLIKPFEKVHRIVTPLYEDWKETGILISKLRTQGLETTPHFHRLINDVLIVLSARRLGALIYTENEKDFEKISKIKKFDFELIRP